MIEIKYHKDVLLFLDELMDILIKKGYFSFYEYSAQYIEDMVDYIKNNIASKPNQPVPAYFSRYGDSLLYITYHSNSQTTWYVLFQKTDSHYFIHYITNNHIEGHYFN
jgi:hypothetical protein